MPMPRAASALLIASFAFCFAPRCFANDVDPYAEALAPASTTTPTSSGNIFKKWFGSRKASETESSGAEHMTAVEDITAAASGPAQRASDLVGGALGLLGIGYRRGGDTPQSGFDCSGMVRYVFQSTLGLDLPRRAEEISRVGTKVNRNDL
ncbi:MAG: NlpC/P60 family protein, partial [Burkholderiaceae bacterium]